MLAAIEEVGRITLCTEPRGGSGAEADACRRGSRRTPEPARPAYRPLVGSCGQLGGGYRTLPIQSDSIRTQSDEFFEEFYDSRSMLFFVKTEEYKKSRFSDWVYAGRSSP